MILIPEQPIIVQNSIGQSCSFDMHKLNEDLAASFKLHGVNDRWLVDQFALTVEEKLRSEAAQTATMSENDIDTLMASLLTASGYSDVANSFTELRGRDPMRRFLAELSPWDEGRIINVLSKRLPLNTQQVHKILPSCRDALLHLRMTHVSDTFIVELAIHLLHVASQDSTPDQIVPKRVRTLAEMRLTCPDYTRELLDSKVIWAYPVAPLFPCAQVTFNFEAFCEHCTHGWPTELAFSTEFAPVASAILDLLREYRHDIAIVSPNFAGAISYIILPHYETLLSEHFKGRKKTERTAFDKSFKDILCAHLSQKADFDVALKFK